VKASPINKQGVLIVFPTKTCGETHLLGKQGSEDIVIKKLRYTNSKLVKKGGQSK
jgi:hypothetical protein